jgi:hypothetical protein
MRRSWRVMSALALVLAAAAILFSAYLFAAADDATNENCERIHAIVKVGGEIIAAGKPDLVKYRDEGTITEDQYVRAVAAVDERLRRWNTADCQVVP